MDNKDKIIEEMAKVMAENWFNETIISTAERLINAGYQKVKDSIVLSREEYEHLKSKSTRIPIDKDGNFIEYAVYDTDRVLSKPEYRDYIYNQASNKTAEKIFKELKTRLKDCPEVIEEGYNVQNSVDYFEEFIGYDKFCADEIIKELAKQFGIEIKE